MNLQAWDCLPRFKILDSDLNFNVPPMDPAEFDPSKKQRKPKTAMSVNPSHSVERHKKVKSIFVGSPIRLPEDGGVMKFQEGKPVENRGAKKNQADVNSKNSIDMYIDFN